MNVHIIAIERTYSDRATVFEQKKYTKSNKTTGFRSEMKYRDIPCRVSFKAKNPAAVTDTAASFNQIITLFLASDYIIEPGSRITVSHDGRESEYYASGHPAVYSTHQEITLQIKDDKC